MEEDKPVEKKEFDLGKKLNEIRSNPRKMWMGLISLIIIFLSLTYIAFYGHKTTTIHFSDGCNETYVDGKLVPNSSECTESREKMHKQNKFELPPDMNFNISNPRIQ